jgi:hypothetical protein
MIFICMYIYLCIYSRQSRYKICPPAYSCISVPYSYSSHIIPSPCDIPHAAPSFTFWRFFACLQRNWRGMASSSDGATLLAAEWSGNQSLWRSTDSGLTWAALSSAGQVRRTPVGRRRTRATSRALHSISQESQPELQYYLCSSENN